MNKTLKVTIILILFAFIYFMFKTGNDYDRHSTKKDTNQQKKSDVRNSDHNTKIKQNKSKHLSVNINKPETPKPLSYKTSETQKSNKNIEREITARQELPYLGKEIIDLENQAKKSIEINEKRALYKEYYKRQQEYFDIVNELGLNRTLDKETQSKVSLYIKEKNRILKNKNSYSDYKNELSKVKNKIFK